MPTSPINDTAPRIQYVATAGQTDFTFPFWITAENDLAVYVASSLQTLTTDYTVSGVLNTSGGSVTFNSGLSAGDVVTIQRSMPFERVSEFQEAGTFKASVLNLELSKLIAMMQQIKGDIGRKIGLSPTSQVNDANLVLPDPVDGKALVFDGASGAMRTSVVNVDDIDSAVTNAQNAATTATGARDTALQAETDAQSAQTAAEAARDDALAASGKVLVSGTDTTAGTLDEKLLAGSGLLKSTANGGADEDLQLAADYATQAQAEAGTNTSKLMTPQRTKQAIDANVVFTEYAEIDFGTLSAGTVHTAAHGLALEPKFLMVCAECISAEHHYSVGDKILLNPNSNVSSSSMYITPTFDGTNVKVRHDGIAALASVADEDAKGISSLSLAAWEIKVRVCA